MCTHSRGCRKTAVYAKSHRAASCPSFDEAEGREQTKQADCPACSLVHVTSITWGEVETTPPAKAPAFVIQNCLNLVCLKECFSGNNFHLVPS